MAKFVFRMQNILDLKEKLEEQQKTAFRNANAVLTEEQEKFRALVARQNGYENELRESQKASLDIKKVQFLKQAIEIMKVKVRDQMFALKKAEEQVEIERRKLDEAIKERKIQEKLKEHAFEDFKKEILYEESKEIDQLVSFTHNK